MMMLSKAVTVSLLARLIEMIRDRSIPAEKVAAELLDVLLAAVG